MRVGLVGCVKTKVDQAAPVQYHYVSTLFQGRRAFVEATCDRWFILSAKHSLVAPEEVLEPYEETMNNKPVAAKRAWAASVLAQLAASVDIPGTVFEVHAGAEYHNFGLIDELRRRGATVEIPAEHLGQGEQLALYSRSPSAAVGERSSRAAEPRPNAPAGRGSYTPLADHLARPRVVARAALLLTDRGDTRTAPAGLRSPIPSVVDERVEGDTQPRSRVDASQLAGQRRRLRRRDRTLPTGSP